MALTVKIQILSSPRIFIYIYYIKPNLDEISLKLIPSCLLLSYSNCSQFYFAASIRVRHFGSSCDPLSSLLGPHKMPLQRHICRQSLVGRPRRRTRDAAGQRFLSWEISCVRTYEIWKESSKVVVSKINFDYDYNWLLPSKCLNFPLGFFFPFMQLFFFFRLSSSKSKLASYIYFGINS